MITSTATSPTGPATAASATLTRTGLVTTARHGRGAAEIDELTLSGG
jgi:hypothetical protein